MPQSSFDALIFTDGGAGFHYKPLGAYRVATELRKAGYRVLVVDFFGKWCKNPDALAYLLRQAVSERTKLVGYSSTFFSWMEGGDDGAKFRDSQGVKLSFFPTYYEKIAKLNGFIKSLNPNTKIVYGGNKASEFCADLYAIGIDYIVQGLADRMTVELMHDLAGGKPCPVFSEHDGVKVINYDAKAAMFDLTTAATRYESEDLIADYEVIPLETSRGCMFKCSFCEYPLLGRKKTDKSYHKTVETLASEFSENYERWGVHKYIFVDDTFNESTDKILDVKKAIDLADVPVEFFAYLRGDLLRAYPEQIGILREMGLRTAFFGLETLNPLAARAIGKGGNIDSLKRTITDAKAAWGDEVLVFGSFIAGLPHETEDTINEWMQWVYESDLDSFVVNSLYLVSSLWKSEITRNPEKYGYQFFEAEVGKHWVNDMGLTEQQASVIADSWMAKGYQSGRLKVDAWSGMLLQRYGYRFDELVNTPKNQIDWRRVLQLRDQEWMRYKEQLFSLVGRTAAVS